MNGSGTSHHHLVYWDKFEAGEFIVREDEADESVFFIVEGKVEVLRHGDATRESVIATLGRDAVIGEMAFLTAAPRSAGIKALEATRILSFSKISFHALCKAEPALGLRVLEKISKATIYRTIPLLLESGLIQEAYFEDGHLHYEHIYGHEHHCHLRCLDCGKVVEFTEEIVKDVEEKVGEIYDFLVTGHKLEVYGHCGKCKVHK